MGNIKINSWEVISTICILALIPLLLTLPRTVATNFSTASVLHSVYISVIALILFGISCILFNPFKDKDILQVAEFVGGKYVKIIYCILIIFFLLLFTSCILEEFSQNIKNVLFTDSTLDEIVIIFIIGMLIGSFFGINGLFKTSGIIFPIVLACIFMIIISLSNQIDLTNLTPILGPGAKEIFIDGSLQIGRFDFLLILFLFRPYIKKYNKISFLSVLSASILIVLIMFLIFSVIPYPTTEENYFALFEITRLISFGRFFQRFESVFVFIWIMITFISISMGMTSILYAIKSTFNLKYINRVSPIIALLILSIIQVIPSYIFLVNLINIIYKIIGPIIAITIPLLLLLIARIKISIGGKNESPIINS